MSKITIKTEPNYQTALVITHVQKADENGEAVYRYVAGDRQSVRVRHFPMLPFEADIMAEKDGVIEPLLVEDILLEDLEPQTHRVVFPFGMVFDVPVLSDEERRVFIYIFLAVALIGLGLII